MKVKIWNQSVLLYGLEKGSSLDIFVIFQGTASTNDNSKYIKKNIIEYANFLINGISNKGDRWYKECLFQWWY